MKKKHWITIICILAAIGIAVAVYFIWFADRHKYYMPEIIEPEIFHDSEFDSDLLIGLWKEDELYYRYNEDGSAVTWDLADDVMEDEGTQLEWTLENDIFTHFYKMDIGGIIPKVYNMQVLELDTLIYADDFGVKHVFSKVEELQLIN